MDAVRIADGEMVALKRVSRKIHPYEREIATMFSTEPLKSDPRNHCVPIFEVLDVPETDDFLLVMPMLRAFNNPPFKAVGEAVEFFRQLFEVCLAVLNLHASFDSDLQGLQFMHECHVAHRSVAVSQREPSRMLMKPSP